MLHDISFSLARGAHCVLSGPTASGKSTLLEVIAGAISPDAGELRLNGESVAHRPPEQRGIGFVPQHGFLFPHLSVRENISYGLRDDGDVGELVARFDIERLLARSVTSLSGGERQLVALCRALAPATPVLLMDEPLSALDDARRETVLRELKAIQARRGLTIVHVTHHAADDMLATDRLTMYEGRLTGPTVSSA